MKKSGHVILLLFLLLSISFVSANSFIDWVGDFFKVTGKSQENNSDSTTLTCTDSDGGFNLNVSGTVTFVYNNGSEATVYYPVNGSTAVISYSDSCDNQNVVSENQCVNNAVTTNNYNCPTGMSCSNGACVGNAENTTTNSTSQSLNVTCIDSDNGINFTKAGTATSSYSNGTKAWSFTDSCPGGGINEAFCFENGTAAIKIYDCPAGHLCYSNGVCATADAANTTLGNCTLVYPNSPIPLYLSRSVTLSECYSYCFPYGTSMPFNPYDVLCSFIVDSTAKI